MEGPQFLKEKFQLQKNAEVQQAAKRTKERTGESVPQTAEAQIDNYLRRFHEILERESSEERERGIQALKKLLHKYHVIDHVPESYLDLQKRILREAGRADEIPNEFSEEELSGYLRTIQEDQRASLDSWIDELAQTGNEFPGWAKYWALRSMLKMGPYDKQKHQFSKRTKNTAAPFPDLNQEALAVSIDYLMVNLSNEEIENPVQAQENENIAADTEGKLVSDEQFTKIIESQDFSKYYAFAIEHVTADNSELFKITEGKWVTYPQGSDPEPLVHSIQGHGTGWCTAGSYTAEMQLEGGDFHVYYSLNNLGEPTIPRLAILMRGDDIDEVRGVAYKQEVDPYISPILDDRLNEFGEKAAFWQKRSQDMRYLTALEEKNQKNESFTPEDIRFLWEIDGDIQGFGYQEDPRIDELREKRDRLKDLKVIFPTFAESNTPESWSSDVQLLIGDVTLSEDTNLPDSIRYIDGKVEIESGNSELALKLLQTNKPRSIVAQFKKFSGLNAKVAKLMLQNLIKRTEEGYEGYGVACDIIDNLDRFDTSEHPEIIDTIARSEQGFNRLHLAEKIPSIAGIDRHALANTFYEMSDGEKVARYFTNFFPDAPDANENPSEFLDFAQSQLTEVDTQTLVLSFFEQTRYQKVHKIILDKFESFNITNDFDLAESLCSTNPDLLLSNLKKFPSVDQMWLLNKLCPETDAADPEDEEDYFKERTSERSVAEYLDAFSEIDPQLIVDRLLQYPETDLILATNMLRFRNLEFNRNPIAQKLIDGGYVETLEENIDGFTNLSSEIALELVQAESVNILFDNPESFNELDNSVAEFLLRKDLSYIDRILDNPSLFPNFDHDSLLRYAMNGDQDTAYHLLSSLDKLNVDKQKVLDYVLREGFVGELATKLYKFQNLPVSLAQTLIEAGYILDVVKNVGSFDGLDTKVIANTLLGNGNEKELAENLGYFPEVDQVMLAEALISKGQSNTLLFNINKFTNVSNEIVTEMLERAGETEVIAKNADKLSGVNHQKAAEDLIVRGQASVVADNVWKYPDADHSILVDKLIEAGESWSIAKNIGTFTDIDQKHVVERLIEVGKVGAVAQNLEKFAQLGSEEHEAIARQIIAEGKGKWMVTNIAKFSKLSEEAKQQILNLL